MTISDEERVARVIQTADEQNGAAPYELVIQNKHSREALFDRARAAIAAMREREGARDAAPELGEIRYSNAFVDEKLSELSALRAIINSPHPAEAMRAKTIGECEALIRDNQLLCTSEGDVLQPRSEGNRQGLAYADAIAALKGKP